MHHFTLKKMKYQEFEFEHIEVPDTSKDLLTKIGTGEILSLTYNLVDEYKFKAEMLYE